MKKRKNLLAFLIGCGFALIMLETFLQIYPPFSFENEDWFLRANAILTYKNPPNFGLDSVVVNRLNSMGFRGEELPTNFEEYLSIITIGGSTTVCRNLSEGKDWPHLLKAKLSEKLQKKIWLNNAGLNGNSTYGHLVLLESQISKIAPDYILYLIGINDIERADLHRGDLQWQRKESYSFIDWLKKNSEVALLFDTLRRQFFGFQMNLNEEMQSLKTPKFQEISDIKIAQFIDNQAPFLKSYERRIKLLLSETQKIGSQPILITQPFLFGKGNDPASGINLETIETWRFGNGKSYWKVLEKYNDITRIVAKEMKIPLLDLAKKMPRSTEYFFDSMHFTNAGSKKVAEIIFEEIQIH